MTARDWLHGLWVFVVATTILFWLPAAAIWWTGGIGGACLVYAGYFAVATVGLFAAVHAEERR